MISSLLATAEHATSSSAGWSTGPLYAILYCFFAALTVASGVMLLLTRDVVRAAFLLLATLAGVAGIYGLLGADFLAFVQVLVYIGGILILLLFGVMLTNREPVLLHNAPVHHLVLKGILAATVAGVAGLYVVTSVDWHARPLANARALAPTSRPLGELLMTEYLLPFEIVSVLLLVALVAAAVIARRRGLTSEPAE